MMQVSSEVSPTSCGARVKRTWKDSVLWTDSILKPEPLPDEVSVLRGTNGDISIISQALNNMPLDGCPLEELGLAAQFAEVPAAPNLGSTPSASRAGLADPVGRRKKARFYISREAEGLLVSHRHVF